MKKNNAIKAVQSAFNGRRRLRSWRNTHFGGMKAVQAHPLAICRFRPDEGGTVSTSLSIKLAPVSGYCRSKAYVDVFQIFAPYQGIEKLELDTQDDAGVTEMTRRRLMAGEGIGLEVEGEITRAANNHPKSIAGQKKLTKTARLAYIASVNHLRSSVYHGATLLDKTVTSIQPAVLKANVLERFNGVLDPERHVDGAINLTGELPVKGMGLPVDWGAPDSGVVSKETGGKTVTYPHGFDAQTVRVKTGTAGVPIITVDLDGTSEITLRDMVKSQKVDALVRNFAQMIQDDPVNGEELVERALYGLSVDYDDNCQVLYRQTYPLSAMHQRPMDGPSSNDVSAHYELNTGFGTVVPRSELGGQLVTIAVVRPVERLAKQPDPAQTESWGLVNRIHDETELEEVLLKRADLETDILAEDEDTDAFWVGHNSIKHDYATEGPNEQQTATVEMKSTMWAYDVPTSVTPENVNYPDAGVDMYTFHNWNGSHAEYTISQEAMISTSLAKGPNPVERIQLFADDPTLVEADA